MDIARNDTELFVVTENGYGKRTPVAEYPVKGRGTKGVLTAKLTSKKGGLAGALIVREHHELVFISQNGMVQRTGVSGISRMGRPTQGVRVMNLKSGDRVSAVARVVESANGNGNGRSPELPGPEEPEEPAAEGTAGNGAGGDGAGPGDPGPRVGSGPASAKGKAAAKAKPSSAWKGTRKASAKPKAAAGSKRSSGSGSKTGKAKATGSTRAAGPRPASGSGSRPKRKPNPALASKPARERR